MSATAAPKASRLVTVRLEPATRERLDELATTSDRTLAQLIRYALTTYFDSTVTSCISGKEDSTSSRHTSVRIPVLLADKVDAAAKNFSVTASDVIRDALANWLASTQPQTLGVPATGDTGEVSA
jgi:predicted transcriptional regulator